MTQPRQMFPFLEALHLEFLFYSIFVLFSLNFPGQVCVIANLGSSRAFDDFYKETTILGGYQSTIKFLKEPNLPAWKNVNITSFGKIPPRTTFMSYNSKEAALTYDFEFSPFYMLLNGVWDFYFVDTYQQLPADITQPTTTTTNWTKINVPGNWEIQGFGVPIYTNTQYDFAPYNPHPPDMPRINPVGVYRRKIHFSKYDRKMMKVRNYYLHISGAKSGVYVYLNGKELGYTEDAKDPVEYLINDYAVLGDNWLVFKIFRYSTGSYLEDQDFWRLSGIERDVYIFSQPKLHVFDFIAVPNLANDYKTGIFNLNISLFNDINIIQKNVTIRYEIYDEDHQLITSDSHNQNFDPYAFTNISFGCSINNIKKWSSETPYLYTLLISIDVKGRITEVIPYKIGFRRIEIQHRKDKTGKEYPCLCVNGVPIKIKGTNIHEHNPLTGHYVPYDLMLKDITLLKQNNFNALRMSHYPQDRKLYDLCDKYGIYVCSESNIETHGMGYGSKSLSGKQMWYQSHLERTLAMYETQKNRACVLYFSLGNEAGNGFIFFKTYSILKERERDGLNRPVAYEGAGLSENSDFFTPMYPPFTTIRNYENSYPVMKPFIQCEYSHAMGNSNGNFVKLWNMFYPSISLQGGFIWDWVDQGIREVDKNGNVYYTYGGDYGENPPNSGNFNINGLVNPDRVPHPAITEVKYAYQYVGFSQTEDIHTFLIKNRFHMINLDDYDITYYILENYEVISTKTIHLDLEPQEEKEVYIDFDLQEKINTDYFINFSVTTNKELPLIPKGFEMAYDQFKLQINSLPKPNINERRHKIKGPKLNYTETNKTISIYSNILKFTINLKTGILEEYKINGSDLIYNKFGLRPNFWRGPTDNDYGHRSPYYSQLWKKLSKKTELKSHNITKGKNGTFNVNLIYKLTKEHIYNITCKIYPNGIVHVSSNFNYLPKHKTDEEKDKYPELFRVGLRFRIPKEFNNVKYYGRGPEENYCDRKWGVGIGLYESKVEDMGYPYIRPQETGHHVDTRWLSLSNTNGTGLLIIADKTFEFNTLRNSVEDYDDQEHTDKPFQWGNNKYPFYKGTPPDLNENKIKNIIKRQTHTNDIIPRDYIEVCLDSKMKGLAGLDSWGDMPLRCCRISPYKNYNLNFTLIPYNQSDIEKYLQYDYN